MTSEEPILHGIVSPAADLMKLSSLDSKRETNKQALNSLICKHTVKKITYKKVRRSTDRARASGRQEQRKCMGCSFEELDPVVRNRRNHFRHLCSRCYKLARYLINGRRYTCNGVCYTIN